MELKLHNILSQLILCTLLYQLSCNTLTFHSLLATFNECSITYYHFINKSTSTIKSTRENTDLVQIKIHFKIVLLQQMVTQANVSAKTMNVTFPIRNTNKLAPCSVLVFPQKHVELSRDLTTINNSSGDYPYFHSEFIWFLKTIGSEHSPGLATSYLDAVGSHLPAVYLEIANFSTASLICFPCIASDFKSEVVTIRVESLNQFGRITVPEIRQIWMKLHTNLRGTQIGMDSKVDWDQSAKYFHPGHTTPYSIYPGKPEFFDECFCAIILIKNMHNFSFGSESLERPIIHSTIYFRHFIDSSLIRFWRTDGLMVSPHGIFIRQSGFISFYDKNELFREQSNLKGILAPFPWWAWINTGAFGILASFLMAIRKEQHTHTVSLRKCLGSCFILTALFIEQHTPVVTSKGAVGRFVTLWFVWATFSLVVSNAYRGFLFSALASVTKPSTPLTVGELARPGMLIGTTSWHWQSENGSLAIKSTLTRSILPKIISYQNNSEKYQEYSRLQKSVYWVASHISLAEFSVQASINRTALVGPQSHIIPIPYLLSVLDSNKSLVVGPYSRKIIIPNKFGIIDSMVRIKWFKGWFQDIGSYWVSNPISEPRFMNHLVWDTHNNYLYRTFTLAIARIYESGMSDRWRIFSLAYSEKYIRKDIRNLTKGIVGSSKNLLKGHSVSRHIYLEILIHFGGFIAVSLLIFSLEWLHQQLTSTKADKTSIIKVKTN